MLLTFHIARSQTRQPQQTDMNVQLCLHCYAAILFVWLRVLDLFWQATAEERGGVLALSENSMQSCVFARSRSLVALCS